MVFLGHCIVKVYVGGAGCVGWRYGIMLDRCYLWAIMKANGGGEGWVGWRFSIMLDRWYFWAIVHGV